MWGSLIEPHHTAFKTTVGFWWPSMDWSGAPSQEKLTQTQFLDAIVTKTYRPSSESLGPPLPHVCAHKDLCVPYTYFAHSVPARCPLCSPSGEKPLLLSLSGMFCQAFVCLIPPPHQACLSDAIFSPPFYLSLSSPQSFFLLGMFVCLFVVVGPW